MTFIASVTGLEWGAYPITFPKCPILMWLCRLTSVGAGESSVPSAGAIANAIFDATGVRRCHHAGTY